MWDCGTQRAFYILEEHRYLNTYLDFHSGTRGNAHKVKPLQEMPSGGPQLLAPVWGLHLPVNPFLLPRPPSALRFQEACESS